MTSFVCESPACGSDVGRCSHQLLCQNTGRLPPQKLIASTMIRGMKERKMTTCQECGKLFDPDANIPSSVALDGLCPSCEHDSLNAFAERLQQDTPGGRLLFGKDQSRLSTELPLTLGATPLDSDVLGKLLKGEEVVTVSVEHQDKK